MAKDGARRKQEVLVMVMGAGAGSLSPSALFVRLLFHLLFCRLGLSSCVAMASPIVLGCFSCL